MWDFFLDLAFPRQCLGCGKWGKYLCASCAKDEIEYFADQVCPYCELLSPYGFTHPRCEKQYGLDGLFVLAHYHQLIPKITHEVKYQGYFAILPEVAELIAQHYHHKFNFQYFVPVPLSKKRERERGFNQAEKLALSLQSTVYPLQQAQIRNNKSVVKLLIRTRDTRPQFDLKMDERKNNVKDAFALNPNLLAINLKPYSFCLIDDVATTGATLFECAKVLKKSGAKNVYAITIARGG